MPDATPEFKQQLLVAFDSIEEGQIFTFQRIFTEGDVALFCGVTGD
jgi:3-hydroxybutyryl-CoA dehydratase